MDRKSIEILLVSTRKFYNFTMFINVHLKIMPFLEDEPLASLGRLDSTPIVLSPQVFPQDRSAVLQLGLADNSIFSQQWKEEEYVFFLYTLMAPSFNNPSRLS